GAYALFESRGSGTVSHGCRRYDSARLPSGTPDDMVPPMGEGSLSDAELGRDARHIVLPEIGGACHQTLRRARVLVLGAGGLGAPVLQYLAAAGVGTLGIVDDDRVALSNLQRQVVHATEAVGLLKAESAKAAIARLNPHVEVELHLLRLHADNAVPLVARYDVVVDGSDNFETRYALADACAAGRVPLVTAAVGRFDG